MLSALDVGEGGDLAFCIRRCSSAKNDIPIRFELLSDRDWGRFGPRDAYGDDPGETEAEFLHRYAFTIHDVANDPWRQSTFASFLRSRRNVSKYTECTHKLVRAGDPNMDMLDILHLPPVSGETPGGVSANWMKDCLIETVPTEQHTSFGSRVYCGIGRVLVCRLVHESHRRGTNGYLRVQVAPRARKFYEDLGFERAGARGLTYSLSAQASESLLDKVKCPEEH